MVNKIVSFQPNVIVIMTDEQTRNLLGCYGNRIIQTPNIDRLAAEGSIFEETFCCSPLCVPSRIGFFTGQYPMDVDVFGNSRDNYIQPGQRSFIQDIKDQGYSVGLAGKNHAFSKEYADKYFDYWEEYGHWGKCAGTINSEDQMVSEFRYSEKRPGFITQNGMLLEGLFTEPEPFPENNCPTMRIAQDAERFLDSCRDNPFFLYYSFPDPHWPNTVCEPYFSMYDDADLQFPGFHEIDWSSKPFAHFVQSQAVGFDKYPERERKKILANIYGQITFIDKAVGVLVDKLKQIGEYDNTVIVFTSDHGNFNGQFGLTGKTKGFYEPLIRIPLILKTPGTQKRERYNVQISNIDIMPTILDICGINYDKRNIQGKSFIEVLEKKTTTHRDFIFSEVGELTPPPRPIPINDYPEYRRLRERRDGSFWFIEYTTRGRSAMIRKDGWKYCYYAGDKDELYNYGNDPYELHNLSNCQEYQTRKGKLKEQLLTCMQHAETNCMEV